MLMKNYIDDVLSVAGAQASVYDVCVGAVSGLVNDFRNKFNFDIFIADMRSDLFDYDSDVYSDDLRAVVYSDFERVVKKVLSDFFDDIVVYYQENMPVNLKGVNHVKYSRSKLVKVLLSHWCDAVDYARVRMYENVAVRDLFYTCLFFNRNSPEENLNLLKSFYLILDEVPDYLCGFIYLLNERIKCGPVLPSSLDYM